MKTILNLTQHSATADQLAAGIIDLPAEFKQELVKIITFPTIYDKYELELRARRVYSLILDLPCDIPVDGVMQHSPCHQFIQGQTALPSLKRSGVFCVVFGEAPARIKRLAIRHHLFAAQ